MASFAEQYGIRLYSDTFRTMKWAEFCTLLSGIGPDTALGRIVSIRAEDDKEALKNYTPEMHRIRNEWRNRAAQQKSEKECKEFVEAMRKTFLEMSGLGGVCN